MKKTWWILVCILVAAGTLAAQGNPGGNYNSQGSGANVLNYIVSPNSIVFSKTFSEWDASWQQWAYSIPVTNHPLFDKGDCSVGQSGMVWFLGGKFCDNSYNCSYQNVQRTCSVPAGKFLYFPVANGEDSAIEESTSEHPGDISYQQIAYLRQFEDPWLVSPPVEFASIDGIPVPDLMRYSVQSNVFSFTIPEDNYLKVVYGQPNDYPAGTYYPAVDQGQYLMLAPLPPGRHVIQFGAAWSTGFAFDVTYTVNVQK